MSRAQDLVVKTEADLGKAVDALLHFAEGRKKIALTGDLGAGKTAFVKAFCHRLGVTDTVLSPTFPIVNEYVFLDENGREQPLHHLDLYRLGNLEEAINIGIEDFLYDANYCLIEWPAVIEALLPDEVVFVKIEAMGDGSRQFLLKK